MIKVYHGKRLVQAGCSDYWDAEMAARWDHTCRMGFAYPEEGWPKKYFLVYENSET